MKWVTRQRIQVNRTATCWLIQRFLDPTAEFLFVAADQVASMQEETGGTGFDAPGARLTLTRTSRVYVLLRHWFVSG